MLAWVDITRFSLSRAQPSPQNILSLQQHIAACYQHIAFLTAVISLTQRVGLPTLQVYRARLLSLHQSRLGFRREVNACVYALAPIRWMPSEILREIFLHCLPDDYRFSPISAPFVLCHVCLLWKEIAMSMRELWNKIAFWTPADSDTNQICYPTRLVGQWLSLSGTLPLDVIFERGITDEHAQVFIELLMDHLPRCRHLELFLTPSSTLALTHFFNLPPGTLRILESLVLEDLDEADFSLGNGTPPISPITIFQESPRLRKLTTDLLEFTYSFENNVYTFDPDVLPWAQLTHIMITDFLKVKCFSAALSECVAIQFLRVSLDLTGEIQDRPVGRKDVTLSYLTNLYISASNGLFFPPSLDIFTFPVLTHFRFRRYQNPRGGIADHKQLDAFSWLDSEPFLDQLSHLQQLTLVGHVGIAEQINVLLRSTPRLIKLNLDMHADYKVLIPAIFPYPSDSGINTSPIPLLRDLELYLAGYDMPVPLHGLHDLVESKQPCQLRNLKICTHGIYRAFRQDLTNKFPTTSQVKLQLGVPNRSARNHDDERLIDHRFTSMDYTMFDAAFH